MVEPAWLLRCVRHFGADARMRTRATFADGAGLVPPVHRSQVTRWESADAMPSYSVVRRYETACGLPTGQLVAAVDLVYRHQQPVAARPVMRRPFPPDPIATAEGLLNIALDGDPMTGGQWDELSALLGELPATLMLNRDWQRLVRRGLHEMEVTVSLEYLQRSEAMARIAGHPRAGVAVTELVASTLSDPTAQVYSESAALLQCCDHPAVTTALLDVTRDPVNVNALRAALFAASTLIRARRFPHPDAVELVGLAVSYCQDRDLPYRVRRAAADVLLSLTPQARRRIAAKLHRQPEDLTVASIVRGEGPRPQAQLRELRHRLRSRIGELAGVEMAEEQSLVRLINYLTAETNDERQSHALVLLMLLPVGPAIGKVYVEELANAIEQADVAAMHESLNVLRCLASADDVELLTDFAVREVPVAKDADPLAVEACWALGNAKFGRRRDDGTDDRIFRAVRQVLDGAVPARPRLLEAWAYALGMRGRQDLLEALPARPTGERRRGSVSGECVTAWEAARRWWLEVPSYLLPEAAGARHRPPLGTTTPAADPPALRRTRQ